LKPKIFITMKNDVDYIISLMKEYTTNGKEGELGEQDDAAAAGGGGAKYPTVTKWETGLARTGPANQVTLTKWKDIVKVNRGKANTLL
jgi:hypothetical protein